MSDSEWNDCMLQMDVNEKYIRSLEPHAPDNSAQRCCQSLHRTLGHLRACQEIWLQASIAFDQRPNSRLKLLHPWRVFEQNGYELILWEEHLQAFLHHRTEWKELLHATNRINGGKLNGNDQTIESLTGRLVAHEQYHLFNPR